MENHGYNPDYVTDPRYVEGNRTGNTHMPHYTDISKRDTIYPSTANGSAAASVPATPGSATDYRPSPVQRTPQHSSCSPCCSSWIKVTGIVGTIICVVAAITIGLIFGLHSSSLTFGPSVAPSMTHVSFFNLSRPCEKNSRFQCASDTSADGCIPISWKCDGFKDCIDNSDETDCPCDTSTEYTCVYGGCVSKSDVCDGNNNCPLTTNLTISDDEWFCRTICPITYGAHCSTSLRCIPYEYTCKGYNTCGDLSDETNCACTPSQFECANTICVPLIFWCDGRKDCRDGDDELPGCQTICPSNGVRCQNSGVCMNPSQICDHISDCFDGSDERNCSCTSSEFRCSDSRCISKLWLCDGTRDCTSGEDETLPQCNTCSSSQFRCKYTSITTCINSTQQCDGVYQCNDTSDEGNCVSNNETSGATENLLLVKYQGASNRYVCSDNWNQTWSDMACKELGMGRSTALTSMNTVNITNATSLLTLSQSSVSSSSNILSYLRPARNCSSRKVVAISCNSSISLVCGSRTVNANSTGPYIVNGQLSARGAWPWQVVVEYDHKIVCGGSVINDRWILTAGHCGVGYSNVSLLEVRAGSLLFNSSADPDAQIFTVDRVIVHSNYANLLKIRGVIINDVTLLHLTKPVIFTDTVRPICLPPTDVNLAQYKVCVATGFGHTRSDAAEVSSMLLQGKMQLITNTACQSANKVLTGKTWNATSSDFNAIICAGNIPAANGIDTCQGDSGGPLACRDQQNVWSIIGVTSFGFYNCQQSVFARVSAYISWISSTIANLH